jgi:hypothetical protein
VVKGLRFPAKDKKIPLSCHLRRKRGKDLVKIKVAA